jgi:hypothetical protein
MKEKPSRRYPPEYYRAVMARYQARQRLASGKILVTCQLCGKQLLAVDWKHLKFHGITTEQYRSMFPDVPTQSPDILEQRKETKYANLYDSLELTDQTKSFLVGTMLGDGCLEPTGGHARYKETAGNREYLRWKAAILAEQFQIRFSEDDYKSKQTGRTYRRHRLATLAHPVLGEWRQNWYPEGKKAVYRPDVEAFLDSFALAVWFYDDGHIVRSVKSYCAYLYTLAFPADDVNWLATLLVSRFGIDCYKANVGKYSGIRVRREGRDRLLDLIRAHPAPGMDYKLEAPQLKTPWWLR